MATMIEELQRQQRINQIPTDGYRAAPAADGSQSNPLNTEFGRNLTNTLSAIPGAATQVPGAMSRIAGAAGNALGASVPAATMVGRMAQTAAPYAPVAGGTAALMSASSPASSSPASPPAAAGTVAPSTSNPTDQRLAGGTQTTPGVGASAALSQVMPGVYQHGRGQYSDNPAGMGFKPGFTGQPTARNISLIDALINGLPPRGATGNRSIAADNATMAANIRDGVDINRGVGGAGPQMSVMGGGTFGFRRAPSVVGAEREDQRSLRYAIGDDPASRKNRASLAQVALEQQGLNQRSLVQTMLDQQRIDQAGEAQGYANRAAGQLEQLRGTLLDPNSTPQQRQTAQQALLAIQGKEPTNRFTVVPGGQQIDPLSQKAFTVPSSVLNNQTGQFVQQPGAAQDQPKFETGKIYIDGNGQRGRWDGSKFVPA